MAKKQLRKNLKRRTSKREKELRASLVLPLGLVIILFFAIIYLNQSGVVGSTVYVSEAATVGKINLMKEGSVTFTVLPATSKSVVITTGISAADDTPQVYSFILSNKESQLYGYELNLLVPEAVVPLGDKIKEEDIKKLPVKQKIAQDLLYAGSSQDISLIYLNLNDTVPDLKVFYAAGKITVQNLHTAATVCGNGLVEGSEKCDDGNILSGDGCSATCQLELKAVPPFCGDDIINQVAEQCDGQDLGGKLCDTQPGFVRGVLSCTADCKLDTAGCVPLTPPVTTSVVKGTKISLGAVAPANNTFSTVLTAAEDFTQTVFIYTVLYDADDKVLALESDEITGGMIKDQFYVVTATHEPSTEVKKKVVLVFDVEPNPIVYGKMEEAFS